MFNLPIVLELFIIKIRMVPIYILYNLKYYIFLVYGPLDLYYQLILFPLYSYHLKYIEPITLLLLLLLLKTW